MVIVVQEVVVRWTKRSRSGAGAALRNRVPELLPLPWVPEAPGGPLSMVHHQATFREEDGFATPVQHVRAEAVEPDGALHFGCVQLQRVEGALEVVFAYTAECGAPARTRYPRRVFRLGEGEWGRVAYNGRFGSPVGEGTWSYHRTTLNVGFTDRLPAGPFSPGPPQHIFSELARLR